MISMFAYVFQLLHDMLNDVPRPSVSNSNSGISLPPKKRRKMGPSDVEKSTPSSTVSHNPDNAPLPDPSLPSDQLNTTQPQATCTTSSNITGQTGPTRLTNLPEGYGGFYTAVVTPNGKEIIIPILGSPPRVAKDHSYCAQKPKKTLKLAPTFSSTELKQQDLPTSTHPPQQPLLAAPDLELEDSDGYQSEEDNGYQFEMEDILKLTDTDYNPSTESSDSESEYEIEQEHHKYNASIYVKDTYADELKQEKYIVFEDNLRELMRFCMKCGSPVTKCKKVRSSCVSYSIECHNGCHYTWKSQPSNASLLVASSIFTTGNTYSKMSSFARALNLKFIGKTTYQDHQRDHIIPVVQKAWNEEREKVVEEMKQKETLVLAGDARCDSPGYNAKYGSYTLMDTEPTSNDSHKKKIVSLEMVQVSEVKNSNHMEPTGLERCLKQIKEDGLKLVALATDRHVMVTSNMKKDHADINHQFDIWHLVKSILKKIMAKSKTKTCEALGLWIRSIANHMWWCSESCGGDDQLLREKWLSLLNHITNKHRWGGSKIFKKCAHTVLTAAEKSETEWLDPKSPAFKALQEIVTATRLLNALPHVTMFCHTGELEVFHSMLLKYCPKRQHFHYDSMKARLYLAALDWNSQTRVEAKDEDGNVKENIVLSKRRNEWVKRVQYIKTSENHVAPLMNMVLECKQCGIDVPKMEKPASLPRHVAKVAKPAPSDIERKSRFGKKQ